ncbi:SPOR domain-containing protein [Sphingomonas sp. 1P06PA]|uniref:SPOR domain-containing protein n=1 Tax=Sphingomonas sp. 1P06PA TaxID=554121 RepID=UPI0039A4BC9A
MIRMMIALLGTTLLLIGCGRKPPPAETAPPPAQVTAPLPEVRDDGPSLPPEDGAGGFRTINSGLDTTEALWHLRSALNVAALNCDAATAPGLVAGYNALLKDRRSILAKAYAAEQRRFSDPRALDLHMTRLYNYFAQPGGTRGFCPVASAVAEEARATAPGALPAFAGSAINRLDAPFQDHYRRWRDYRVALAAWRAGTRAQPPAPAQPRIETAARTSDAGGWLVQLGAFSGQAAARTAWDRIRTRAPGFASYTPRYEDVPGKSLVRVRIGPAKDRSTALAMCATAAAAGLDCAPVASN